MLNSFSNIFIFCINVCIDEVLLLDKNKGLWFIHLEDIHIDKGLLFDKNMDLEVSPLELFPFLEESILGSASYNAKQFKEYFRNAHKR